MDCTVNFRDIGGCVAYNGKAVKKGVFYRSGDMETLTDADLKVLDSLNLKTIVDFRTDEERMAVPDRTPASVKKVVNLVVEPGSIFDLSEVTGATGPDLMKKLNVFLVNEARTQYIEFFRILSNPVNTPLLFHCSAGKDRTGYAAALLLAAFDVERKIIFADYMASAPNIEAKYGGLLRKYPELIPAITVHQEYILAAFNEIDHVYGGTEKYLTRELDVNLTLLRDLYLE